MFSWIVYKSRAHRDRVNAKVMKDPRLANMMDPKDDALRRQAHGLRRLQGPGRRLNVRGVRTRHVMNILTINLLCSTLVFWVAARVYVLPKLSELRPQTVLLPILLLHSFRHLGLMFLAPGATYAGIPSQFAFPAALGDLLAAVLALIALLAVARGMKRARILVWIFNVEGTLDLIAAVTLATVYGSISIHGAGILDPCILGACPVGDALHHVCYSR